MATVGSLMSMFLGVLMKPANVSEMEAQVINHLGLVSAEYEKIGISQILNNIFPKHPNSKLSINDCVKILTLNSLDFTGRPLYLTHSFFTNKPVDILIGEGVSFDIINDDVLGRALDDIYDADPTLLFHRVAYRAAKEYGLNTKILHGDTSSKVLFGAYEGVEGQDNVARHGFSKDKRPDLKQLMFSLLVSNEGNFPLFGGIIPGNTSDTVHFREMVTTLRDNLNFLEDDTIVVFDSQFHTDQNIHELENVNWVTRVPDKTNLAKKVVRDSVSLPLTFLAKGYSGVEFSVKQGSIRQRWLVVRSEKAHKLAKHSVARAVKKEKNSFEDSLKKLNSEGFSCRSDAEKSLKKQIKKLNYHGLDICEIKEITKQLKRGRPTATSPKKSIFKLAITLTENPIKIEQAIEKQSRFIIGTNILNTKDLSSEDLLKTYKDQHKVERGFRFLKNPLCMARAIYLKKQSRIVALGFIMLVALLVYSAIEYGVKRSLEKHNETIPNQLKKPTQKPTGRWLFELFEDVVIVTVYDAGKVLMKKVMNLKDDLKKLLRLLGPAYCQMYLVS